MAFAIFAGIVIFSLVFLYTKTADSWNWKKIILWFIGLVVVFVLIVVGFLFKDQFFGDPQKTGKYTGRIQSYKGVAIGSKLSDIEFKYGRLKNNKATDDSKIDFYVVEGAGFGVYANQGENTATSIVVLCGSSNYDTFNGIGCRGTGDEIEKKFGKDLKIQCSRREAGAAEADMPRAYDVQKYGTRYVLVKNKVQYVGFMPDSEFNGDGWGECK